MDNHMVTARAGLAGRSIFRWFYFNRRRKMVFFLPPFAHVRTLVGRPSCSTRSYLGDFRRVSQKFKGDGAHLSFSIFRIDTFSDYR